MSGEVFLMGNSSVTKAAGVIRVSYPANSTLVVKGTSSGKQFAKDTNTTSSAKAYIFLAPIGNTSYTLTATNTAGKTVSKQVYVAKDQVQTVTLDYFSATIKVTYPAKSKCVIKNSSGTQVTSDTNTGTSAKTWTATVNAKGTYTVTATATDGSGKTKSTTVSITADGQVKTVTLTYEMILWEAGADQNTSITGGFAANDNNYVKIGDSTVTITGNRTYFGEGSNDWSSSGNFYTKKKVAKGEFKYFCANITTNTGNNANNKAWLYAANEYDFTGSNTIAKLEIPVTTGATGIFKMPLTGVTSAVLGIRVYGENDLQKIVMDKIWLE